MVDVVDAANRSRMMAGIRAKNTKPEAIIRKGLHARGLRYSLHPKRLPGKPDIVLPKWRVVIFVHGCFWHKHGCQLSKTPSSNTTFWEDKLAANQRRDVLVKQQLSAAGWRVVVIWECATRGKVATGNLPDVLDRLVTWIRDQAESAALEISGANWLGAPASDEIETR